MGEKKKNKKKKNYRLAVRTLMTATGERIPIPLTKEEDMMQLIETLQRSTVKKRTTNIPYLERVGPSELELQKKALEEAAKRKAAMQLRR